MDRLTPREYQVAMLVARGLSNKVIAHQLGISHGTVKQHMHKIIEKLGVKSRFEAMPMLLREAAARRDPNLQEAVAEQNGAVESEDRPRSDKT
jgi:two-component system nitrate/nitrite response regulator NarP